MPARALRIMIVDEHPQRAELLARALEEAGYEVIALASTDDDLPRSVAKVEPDVVLIDLDSPSRDTLEQIDAMNRRVPRPVVLFTRQQDSGFIERAVCAGVTAYVVDGLSSTSVRSVIDVAVATFDRFQSLRSELERTRTSLEERKTIERAKGVLMRQRRLSEPQAYRMLQKMAMDRKRKLFEIAEDVIEMAALLTGDGAEPRR